jgi:hypothetical protein
MDSLWLNRQYYLGDAFWDFSTQREETHGVWLYGKVDKRGMAPTSVSRPFVYRGVLTDWAWSTLVATDIFGNGYHHEVAPINPY